MSTEPQRSELSTGAAGGIVFAGVMMMMVGTFQAISGLVGIFDDDFYVVAQNYTFDLDTTAWGFLHLIIGSIVAFAGYGVLTGSAFGGYTAIFIASLSAISNFFFIPYYPFWSILIIAIDIWIIWALTRPGAIE